MGKVEYWQCCHTRKCKWVGKYEELEDKRIDSIEIKQVCPKCGNDTFYVLNSEEYEKLQKKSKAK